MVGGVFRQKHCSPRPQDYALELVHELLSDTKAIRRVVSRLQGREGRGLEASMRTSKTAEALVAGFGTGAGSPSTSDTTELRETLLASTSMEATGGGGGGGGAAGGANGNGGGEADGSPTRGNNLESPTSNAYHESLMSVSHLQRLQAELHLLCCASQSASDAVSEVVARLPPEKVEALLSLLDALQDYSLSDFFRITAYGTLRPPMTRQGAVAIVGASQTKIKSKSSSSATGGGVSSRIGGGSGNGGVKGKLRGKQQNSPRKHSGSAGSTRQSQAQTASAGVATNGGGGVEVSLHVSCIANQCAHTLTHALLLPVPPFSCVATLRCFEKTYFILRNSLHVSSDDIKYVSMTHKQYTHMYVQASTVAADADETSAIEEDEKMQRRRMALNKFRKGALVATSGLYFKRLLRVSDEEHAVKIAEELADCSVKPQWVGPDDDSPQTGLFELSLGDAFASAERFIQESVRGGGSSSTWLSPLFCLATDSS